MHACVCARFSSSLFADNDDDGRARGSGAVWGRELKLAKVLDNSGGPFELCSESAQMFEHAVEVALPTAKMDISAAYEDAIHMLSTKPRKEEKVDAATSQEDFYHKVRSTFFKSLTGLMLILRAVCWWLGSFQTSSSRFATNLISEDCIVGCRYSVSTESSV
jgi:hypothetical protein